MALTRADAIRVERDIRLNRGLLRDCRGPHDFELIQDGEVFLRYRCKVCCGEVTADQFFWFHRGLEHGRIKPA